MRILPAILLLCPALAFGQGKSDTPVKLTVDKLTLTTAVPAAWGKGTTLPGKEDDTTSAWVPVIDDTMEYSGLAFTKPVPSVPDTDPASLSIALAALPAKFKDDPGSTGPEEDQDPFAITAAQKDKAVKKLAEIYEAKAVNPADFYTPEMESAPGLVGGWWGSPDAVLDILAIDYFETGDGAFRGVAYFYTAGQDVSFNPSYAIALYNPEARAVILVECPVGGFKELKPYMDAVNNAMGEDIAPVMKEYAKGEKFLRDRAAWKDTSLGRFIDQVDGVVKAAVLTK